MPIHTVQGNADGDGHSDCVNIMDDGGYDSDADGGVDVDDSDGDDCGEGDGGDAAGDDNGMVMVI